MTAEPMKTNDELKNAEFRVAFTETNLRFALVANPLDNELIARIKAQLDDAERALRLIQSKGETT